jgi:hypothetical protein
VWLRVVAFCPRFQSKKVGTYGKGPHGPGNLGPLSEILDPPLHGTMTCIAIIMFIQILMNVLLVLITVTLMLPVSTLLVASLVPVTRDTLEMGSHAVVGVLSSCVGQSMIT